MAVRWLAWRKGLPMSSLLRQMSGRVVVRSADLVDANQINDKINGPAPLRKDGTPSPFRTSCRFGEHEIISDEPERFGGLGEGPNPYDLLMGALGSCTTMTIKMYAARKGLDRLEGVTVELSHAKVHVQDCTDCGEVSDKASSKSGRIDRIERKITLHGLLTDEERGKLFEIANKCPVHKTLEKGAVVVSTLSNDPAK